MLKFFFYNKLNNLELIKKININFEIYDGYILIQNYDIENNILEINNKSSKNNKLLYGKIVNFNMTLDDIIKKINEIDECKLDKIFTNKTFGGMYKAYIIY